MSAEWIGVAPLLDACLVSATLGVRKPDPRIFELAAEQCDQTARGAWMIGDSEADIVGAARAGARSAWLTRGRTWTRHDLTPDVSAPTLTDALHAVSGTGCDQS